MRVILKNDCVREIYEVYTSKGNLTDAMRKLWEDDYNQLLADGYEVNEIESWFEEDQAQISRDNGFLPELVSEFVIIDVKEVLL